MQLSEGLFMKHYININNSGYSWLSVPWMMIAKKAKMSFADEMSKIYKSRSPVKKKKKKNKTSN